jgi:hypothetical protein
MTTPVNRPGTAQRKRATPAAASMLLLASACTASGDPDPTPTGTPPATTTPPSPTPTPSPTPSPTPRINPAAIQFTYQAPDPVCVPVDELSLPGADQHDYHTDSSLIESYNIRIGCVYELDTIVDADHVRVYIRTSVFPHREDSNMVGVFPEVPIDSTDLAEWAVTSTGGRDFDSWDEGCPLEPTCGEGEGSTTDTVARESWFSGMVGNLEVDARVAYIARDIPDDVFAISLEIFRAYVIAELDRRENTIHDW